MERMTRKRYVILGLSLVTVALFLSALSHPAIYPAKLSSIVNIGDDSIDTNLDNHVDASIGTNVDASLDEPEDAPVEVKSAPTKQEDWTPKTFPAPEKKVVDIINLNVMNDSKDKILLTAVVNSGMADYTLNWIESLKKCDLEKHFLVFAIDDELVDLLTEAGYGTHVVKIPDDWFHKKLSGDFASWKVGDYTPITHSKSLVVERLLYLGITVWFSDVDIVFTNPSIYHYLLLKLKSRKDAKTKQELTEVLFTQELEQRLINSGFYLMRPTNTNKRIIADSIDIQDKEPQVTQQTAMNRILDDMDLGYHSSPIALLDLALFPHGRYYFENKVPTKFEMIPMMVHANYRK
jgi:Nucleotide-diphospho-sugar transferase